MILLAGPPGAGKSVQARMIEEASSAVWLSAGHLLREKMTGEFAEKMNHGQLIDDTVVEDILAEAIFDVPNGTRIILDGFPRRDSQVAWFRGYLKGAHRNLQAVIHLKVSREECVRRLATRGRADDDESVVNDRYTKYEEEIIPMIEHLESKDMTIIEIDGERDIETIHKDIMDSLKGIL